MVDEADRLRRPSRGRGPRPLTHPKAATGGRALYPPAAYPSFDDRLVPRRRGESADKVRRPLKVIDVFHRLVLIRSPWWLRAAAVTFWNLAARASMHDSRGASP